MAQSVAIVGTGHVGMAAAYSIFQRRLADSITLVDLDKERNEGEAMDLVHGQSLVGRVDVTVGETATLGKVDLVVLTAGVAQKPGESRLDLVARNVEVFRKIINDLDRQCPDAILLVASNPVDVLTWVAQRLSHRPSNRIVGTGTSLDTSRLRSLVGDDYGVDPKSVHGYVLGEHGDSEFVAWSTVQIAGVSLTEGEVLGHRWDPAKAVAVEEEVRSAAAQIIERKGHTNLAIGLVIATLVDAFLSDGRTIHPVSVLAPPDADLGDVCLSLPSRLGHGGVTGTVVPPLTDTEHDRLRTSARVLKDVLPDL